MAEEFNIDNDLPVTSTVGWMQMEALLNKDLPVKKKVNKISVLLYCLPALLLCSIFIFSSLQLDNNLFDRVFPGNKTQAEFTILNKIKSSLLIHADKKQSVKSKLVVENRSHREFEFNNKANLPIPVKNQFNMDAAMPVIENRSNANFIKYFPEKKERIYIPVIALARFSNHLNSSDTIVNADKKHQYKEPWEFSAGLAINVIEGKQLNLQPYPTAEVKCNLNSHFFIATGLSLLSPKPGSISGITKTVYVNDTANNISLYNEVVSYNHLRYADMPLTVGVNITKKLMFQTGLQLSVLMRKQQKRSLQPYDFQMNNIYLPVTPSLVGMAANPQQEFTVPQPKIDYRFIAGIKYKLNRTTVGLFYQHGLQSSGKANNNSVSKGLFTFSLMYQFK